MNKLLRRIMIGVAMLLMGALIPAFSAIHAAHQLFPTEYATHVATKSGNWFDKKTWNTGTVPGRGALVYIPKKKTITYEGNGLKNNPDIFMIRVDGRLDFRARNNSDTRLRVDTLVTSSGSHLRGYASRSTDGIVDIAITPYNLKSNPVNSYHVDGLPVTSDWSTNKSYKIDDGNGVLGRYSWDPKQLSLGIVAEGTVRFYGKSKVAHIKATRVSSKSASSQSVINWKDGDTVLVTGTRFNSAKNQMFNSAAELATIRRVSKKYFRFKRPLKNTALHQPDAFNANLGSAPKLLPSIANLSRNVIIRSALATDTRVKDFTYTTKPASSNYYPHSADYIAGNLEGGTHRVTQRGHFMVMGDPNSRVQNIALLALGRTDKSGLIDDFKSRLDLKDVNKRPYITRYVTDVSDVVNTGVANDPSKIVNQRGRYSLHLHKVGINDSDGAFGAQIKGNVVLDSVGWGYVQHSSEAFFVDNIAYKVLGAAFISETGDETGLWYGNLAVESKGAYTVGEPVSDPPFAHWSNDVARSGVGFWTEGRGLAVINNIASGVGTGFVNQPFGIDNLPMTTEALKRYQNMFDYLKRYYRKTFTPNAIEKSSLAALGAYGRGLSKVMHNEFVPIRYFVGNEVFNANNGLHIFTGHDNTVRKYNDAWSYMRDFTAWQVQRGVDIQYTSKYVFDNVAIKGPNKEYKLDSTSAAVRLGSSSSDFTFNNTKMQDFDRGFWSTSAVGTRSVKVARHGIWTYRAPSTVIDNNGDGIKDSRDFYTARGARHALWSGWQDDDPAYNAENKNFINTQVYSVGRTAFAGPWRPKFYLDMKPRIGSKNSGFKSDSPTAKGVDIQLANRSLTQGLNALWREQYNTPAIYKFTTKGQQVPFGFRNKQHARVMDASTNRRVERKSYSQLTGLNDDLWSGTLLEFDKKTGFGTQRFAYYDFVGDWGHGNSKRTYLQTEQTHNERIIFTRDQINATLAKQRGYYSLGTIRLKVQNGSLEKGKFVVMDSIFTDPTNGMLYVKKFAVLLDEKWCRDMSTGENVCPSNTYSALNRSLGDLDSAHRKGTVIKSPVYYHYRAGKRIKRLSTPR